MLFLQACNQVAVDLDDMQMIQPGQQGFGERPQPGAYLDHGVGALRVNRRDDGGNDAAIDQEVLPETLAGDMAFHQAPAFLAAMRAASASASNRLPGSARPLPASSSAVP